MTFEIRPDGTIAALWTDRVNLRALGDLHVSRASTIDFDAASQRWRVHVPGLAAPLFSSPSYQECRDWETSHDHVILAHHRRATGQAVAPA